MNQAERRAYLISALRGEREPSERLPLPATQNDQKQLLRALMNVRPPLPLAPEVLAIQDEYLAEERERKGVVSLDDLTPVLGENLYLWQGDITRLAVDGIVNAANDQMLGCFVPGHHCIDNAIHTFAGMQLRLKCHEIMEKQNHPEPTGQAKITSAYNLPSTYVLHTVGPIISGPLTERDRELLALCYTSCFEVAAEHKLESIAFCCISTGAFHFPAEEAADIALAIIRKNMSANIAIVINVFNDSDKQIYEKRIAKLAKQAG